MKRIEDDIQVLNEKYIGGVYSSYDMAKAFVAGQKNVLENLEKEDKHRTDMEQETKAKFEQAMELADKFEKGYDAGAYDTKTKILRWATEHKKAIEANGDDDDAFERGEYSILNALIDKLNSM